jgi:hypothetical protein
MLLVGTALAATGFFWLSHIQSDSTYLSAVLGPGCTVSLSLGLLFTPLASAATAGVAPLEAGLASGVLNTSRQLGGSLGLAVLATVATDHYLSQLHGGAARDVALTAGYARAFAVACVVAVVAFAGSFIVPSVRRATAGEPVPGDGSGPTLAEAGEPA